MTERIAYIFKHAIECQECGEAHFDELDPELLLGMDPAADFEEPGTWYCANCGEPLFPEEWERAREDA